MSDTFIVAAKLRLSKKAVSSGLRSPFPSRDVIPNRDQMFDGWYWNGKSPIGWDQVSTSRLVKHRFARIADFCVDSESESTVAFYNGKKKAVFIYHMMIDYSPASVCETLKLFGRLPDSEQ